MKEWFSAYELADFGKAGIGKLPRSAPGCTGRAITQQWEYREVKGKGGKGGVRTEYKPPQDTLNDIQRYLSKSKHQVNQETVQYETLKVYQDNVVKLNAKPKMWLEEIINYFVSLPEEEQQKINTYSKDLYEKVKNYDQRKKVKITISGLVEVPLSEDEDGNDNESKGNVQ